MILGFGMGGQLLGRALRQLATPYVILDLNGATVRRSRKEGESIFFGDATNEDALRAAGVARAKAVVGVLSDPYAAARALTAIRSINESVPIILRTRYKSEAEAVMRQGATVAVAEEMEASLEVLAQTIARLDVPGNVIDVLLDSYRRESMGMRTVRAPSQPLGSLPGDISKTPIATHALGAGDWAVGRTLAEVNLRADTGALVIAVQQRGKYHHVAARGSATGGWRRLVSARRRQRHHARAPPPDGRRFQNKFNGLTAGCSWRTAAGTSD